MFPLLVILFLACTVASATAESTHHEPAPPFDLLERAFDVLEREAGSCMHSTDMTDTLNGIVARLTEIENKVGTIRDTVTRQQASLNEMENKVGTIMDTVTRQQASLNEINDTVTTGTQEIKNKMDSLDTSQKLNEINDTVTGGTSGIKTMVSSLEASVTTGTQAIKDKMDILDTSQKLNEINDTVTTGTQAIKDKMDSLDTSQKLNEISGTVDTVKTRQQAALSEVRLISLYKLTGESIPLGTSSGYYPPGLVVDGQYTFSTTIEGYMKTYSHTGGGTNNKIWIDLGGLFRVYSVRVWNIRHCCRSFFDGTEIYVGDDTQLGTLIGTASVTRDYYDFPVSGAKYGSRVTLRQPRSTHIALLEVQVWGNGPYDSTDKFN